MLTLKSSQLPLPLTFWSTMISFVVLHNQEINIERPFRIVMKSNAILIFINVGYIQTLYYAYLPIVLSN
jgi:hypothetical protein